MTVQDCLNEYKMMGHKIFGKPRLLCQRNIAVIERPKYSHKRMKKVFEEVTARRSEGMEGRIKSSVQFPSKIGVCKT